MFIQTESTPNAEVLKFLPGREVLPGGSREFRDRAEGEASPLARALYAMVEVDEIIPQQHYEAVAKIIGFIFAGKRPGGRAR